MLGLKDIESPRGLITLLSSGAKVGEEPCLLPKYGETSSYSEDIQLKGFLMKVPKLNFWAFFGAEYRPGERSNKKPTRTIIAVIFLRIGASLIDLGTPRGMMGND